MADDYLSALKLLWTREVASHRGPYVRFENGATAPRPLRSPHPPIWVVGSSRAALRRAVRFGTAWHPIQVRVNELRADLEPLEELGAVQILLDPYSADPETTQNPHTAWCDLADVAERVLDLQKESLR